MKKLIRWFRSDPNWPRNCKTSDLLNVLRCSPGCWSPGEVQRVGEELSRRKETGEVGEEQIRQAEGELRGFNRKAYTVVYAIALSLFGAILYFGNESGVADANLRNTLGIGYWELMGGGFGLALITAAFVILFKIRVR